MSLLEVRDLAVTFRLEGRDVEAVRHASFRLERGRTLALVGESGSGKSVTALSIMQLLPYPRAVHPAGSIRLDGEDITGLPTHEIVRRGVAAPTARMVVLLRP